MMGVLGILTGVGPIGIRWSRGIDGVGGVTATTNQERGGS